MTRIPLGLLFYYVTWKGYGKLIQFLIIGLAGLTDKLDGEMAKREGPSRWGALMDPWCDKIFVLTCGIALWNQLWKPSAYSLGTIETFLFIVPFFALKRPDINVESIDHGKTKFALECLGLLTLVIGQTLLGNALLCAAIPYAGLSIWHKGNEIYDSLKGSR